MQSKQELNLTKFGISFCLLFSFLLFGCLEKNITLTGDEIVSVPIDPSFYNGFQIPEGSLTHTVLIKGNSNEKCLAVKIGENKFLTTAHCLVDPSTGDVLKSFNYGAKLKIFTTRTIDSDSIPNYLLTTSYVDVHQSYLKAAKQCISELNYPKDYKNQPIALLNPDFFPADIAVITTSETSTGIPIADIDFDNAIRKGKINGDPVLLTGIDCNNTGNSSSTQFKLFMQVSRSLDPMLVFDQKNPIILNSDKRFDELLSSYFFTAGFTHPLSSTFNLCSTALGGPIFRYEPEDTALTNTNIIVGLNSYTTYSENITPTNSSKWNTRIDRFARGDYWVSTWLKLVLLKKPLNKFLDLTFPANYESATDSSSRFSSIVGSLVYNGISKTYEWYVSSGIMSPKKAGWLVFGPYTSTDTKEWEGLKGRKAQATFTMRRIGPPFLDNKKIIAWIEIYSQKDYGTLISRDIRVGDIPSSPEGEAIYRDIPVQFDMPIETTKLEFRVYWMGTLNKYYEESLALKSVTISEVK